MKEFDESVIAMFLSLKTLIREGEEVLLGYAFESEGFGGYDICVESPKMDGSIRTYMRPGEAEMGMLERHRKRVQGVITHECDCGACPENQA